MTTKIQLATNNIDTSDIKDGLNYLSSYLDTKGTTLEILKKQPFYTGESFTLPSTVVEGRQVIKNMENEMEKMDPKSGKYKRTLANGIVIIHWTLCYLKLKEHDQSTIIPNRVDFITDFFKKTINFHTSWGTNNHFNKDLVESIMQALCNNKELPEILNILPIEALENYGW